MITFEEYHYPALAAAIAAAVILALWHREASRQAGALAVGWAFIVGYVLIPWAPFQPKLVWHWVLYIAAAATLVAPAFSGRLIIAVPVGLASAAGIAYLIMPDWDSLADLRVRYMMVFAASVLVAWLALIPLARRVNTLAWALLLTLTALCTAVLLVLTNNLRFAQLAGLVASASLGCFAVCLVRGGNLQGAMVPYVALLGSLVFVGFVYSQTELPLASYLLIPAAPAALWLSMIPPVKSLNGKWRLLAQIILALIPLAVGLVLALRVNPPWLNDAY